jgi:hypothetical protein
MQITFGWRGDPGIAIMNERREITLQVAID